MTDWLKQVKESWNETADSEWYQSLRTDEIIAKLVENPTGVFHKSVYNLINKYIPDLHNKKVLLPSSGDNHAAFAFALLGADVTSADISEKQLEHAKAIADKLKLKINFVCDDTMLLSNIPDNRFDLVYTSNGTHTWIADLPTMYKNIHRVLKADGFSIMYDVHPFTRPFVCEPWEEPKIVKPYTETLPQCHWRVQDLINSMTGAGLSVREMEELQAENASFWFSYEELIKQTSENLDKVNNWEYNPMAALPAWISIVAQK